MFLSIADRVKNLELTVEEAIFELQGESAMLRWFACDCAEHAMGWAKSQRLAVDKRSVFAVKVARKLVSGNTTEESRFRAAFGARDAARSEPLHGVSDAAKATVEKSPSYAAMAAAEAASRAAGTFGRRRDEISWQRHRLAYLCEVWAACGHRAHWLLWEGKCPIEPSPEAELPPL